MKTISILGAGWLGFRLGLYLQKNFRIKASTTSPEKMQLLENSSIIPYLIQIEDKIIGNLTDFLDTDILFINIPPKRKQNLGQSYMQKMQLVSEQVLESSIKKIIFISSTSVYPDHNQLAKETDLLPETDLLIAENIFSQNPHFQTLILRCGGLTGYDRIIGKYFSGKSGLTNGKEAVNLIHIEDLIRIIELLIEQDNYGKIINICSPMHPLKEEVYTNDCKKLGLPLPSFAESKPQSKVVCTEKLERLGYEFIYPNPLDF